MVKETYFTSENINNQSQLLLSQLQQCGNKRKFSFQPEKSALLILDMQKFFLKESSHAYIPSSETIISRIKSLIELYEGAGLPIIATRHINTDNDAKLMKSWWRDIILEDNTLSEIAPELVTSNTYIINKTQYDAFYRTDLEEYLNKKDITQLVVTGVMTHLCCETTVRSAFIRDFEVFFPIDATATYNLEFHKATFTNLSHGFTVPLLVKDIEANMRDYNVAAT